MGFIEDFLLEYRDRVRYTYSACWEWTARLSDRGYAVLDIDNKTVRVHKYLWEHLHGQVPKGKELDHLCHNKCCINPNHLEPVTHLENMRRRRKTICQKGHIITIENSYDNGVGGRSCRICVLQKARLQALVRAARRVLCRL